MGHDEYWTPTMRDRVASARDRGTNLAFIGANTMYWRIRLANRPTGPNRLIVGYRSDAFADPAPSEQDTARFRDAPSPHPENDVTGMQYECFPVDTDYRIVSPGWWGFRGTGVGEGDRFEHLVGIEADRVYPIASTPRPLQILSHTTYRCRGTGTSSESTYYTTSSGAGVIDLGTLRWTCALKGRCGTYQLPRRTIAFVKNGYRQHSGTVRSRAGRSPFPGRGQRQPVQPAHRQPGLSQLTGVPSRYVARRRSPRRRLRAA